MLVFGFFCDVVYLLQLSYLVEDFMEGPLVDPSVKDEFKKYLARHATRSLPTLEKLLDWLLALYKVVFPFVLLSLLAKVGGSSSYSNSRGSIPIKEHQGGIDQQDGRVLVATAILDDDIRTKGVGKENRSCNRSDGDEACRRAKQSRDHKGMFRREDEYGIASTEIHNS